MATPAAFRLSWDGTELEVLPRRAGWRTEIELWRDGEPVGTAVGGGRVLLPVPVGAPVRAEGEQGPTVLVLAALPGVVNRAFLLVPRPGRPDGEAEDAGAPSPTPWPPPR